MIEQFYAIGHLTTEQLRELFSSNRNRGWVDYEYYKLMPEGGVLRRNSRTRKYCLIWTRPIRTIILYLCWAWKTSRTGL